MFGWLDGYCAQVLSQSSTSRWVSIFLLGCFFCDFPRNFSYFFVLVFGGNVRCLRGFFKFIFHHEKENGVVIVADLLFLALCVELQCDPEAAKIVLLSGIPLVMIPLEVTGGIRDKKSFTSGAHFHPLIP